MTTVVLVLFGLWLVGLSMLIVGILVEARETNDRLMKLEDAVLQRRRS